MMTLFRMPQNVFIIALLLTSRLDDAASDNYARSLSTCSYVLIMASVCLVATFGVTGRTRVHEKEA